MPSFVVNTGLFVLAGLSNMALFATQVAVMAQDNGIAPVNPGLASSSQSSVSVIVVTSTVNPDNGMDPSPFLPPSISTVVIDSATTVTTSAITVTGSPVTVTASTNTANGPVTVTDTGSAVTVTASASTVTAGVSTVTASIGGVSQLFSLPAEQAVITQAPCVSACLQAAVIASAAGSCGRTAGIAIDNACGCLSAPLNALQALTNCASAACTGLAAGSMDPASGSVVVASLYNNYCLTAVDPGLYSQATASGSSSTETASQTIITSTWNTASVGSMLPGFTTGNSTFSGFVTPTVTTTDIVTAGPPAPAATMSAGEDHAGNNTGTHNSAGRGVSGQLTMTLFMAGFVFMLSRLLR